MNKIVRFYIGNSDSKNTAAQRILRQWIAGQSDVDLICESIHADPAVAIRFQITDLPALVVEDELVAQGPAEEWLTEPFLFELSERLSQ